MAQRFKHLPATWETWVQSLGRDDPLEKCMATHSSILVWRIPWTEEPGGLHFTAPQMSTRLSETVAEGLAELRAPGMGDFMSQWIGEWIFEDTGK